MVSQPAGVFCRRLYKPATVYTEDHAALLVGGGLRGVQRIEQLPESLSVLHTVELPCAS